MNSEWEEFLASQGAKIENNRVTTFGQTIAEENAAFSSLVLADLSHYGLIEASGDDVIEFLQGQTTNDIKSVTEHTGQLSAYCNPKGRILANFRIFKRDNHFYLRLRGDILEATLKRLRMFVMRSKVELVDSSDNLVRFGIAGVQATNALSVLFKEVPDKVDNYCTENDISLIKLPGDVPRYEAHGPVQSMLTLWQRLVQADAVMISENSWNLLTVRAGIPEIVSETVEDFVPQMVNLQAINSLSFTKGCYPGQEVVARMHYLGKNKRRLFLASVTTDTLPQPGQAILTSEENEEKAGEIVSASWSEENKAELLAVLQIAKAEQSKLHLNSTTGPELKLHDLPYSLEIEETK